MSPVPVLTTERLVLREHREADLAEYTALWSDREVVRFITGKPLDMTECWSRLLRFRGMWEVVGYGFWIIEHRQSGKVIGEAGVMDAKRDMTPSLDGTLEAGWALHPSTHGRGLAREAVSAALAWADQHHPDTPQSCIIAEGNTASIGLAERLGFRETGRGPFGESDLIHYRRRPV